MLAVPWVYLALIVSKTLLPKVCIQRPGTGKHVAHNLLAESN